MDTSNSFKAAKRKKKIISSHYHKKYWGNDSSFAQSVLTTFLKKKLLAVLKNNKLLAEANQQSRQELQLNKDMLAESTKNIDIILYSRFKLLDMAEYMKKAVSSMDEILSVLSTFSTAPTEKFKQNKLLCRKIFKTRLSSVAGKSIEECEEPESQLTDFSLKEQRCSSNTAGICNAALNASNNKSTPKKDFKSNSTQVLNEVPALSTSSKNDIHSIFHTPTAQKSFSKGNNRTPLKTQHKVKSFTPREKGTIKSLAHCPLPECEIFTPKSCTTGSKIIKPFNAQLQAHFKKKKNISKKPEQINNLSPVSKSISPSESLSQKQKEHLAESASKKVKTALSKKKNADFHSMKPSSVFPSAEQQNATIGLEDNSLFNNVIKDFTEADINKNSVVLSPGNIVHQQVKVNNLEATYSSKMPLLENPELLSLTNIKSKISIDNQVQNSKLINVADKLYRTPSTSEPKNNKSIHINTEVIEILDVCNSSTSCLNVSYLPDSSSVTQPNRVSPHQNITSGLPLCNIPCINVISKELVGVPKYPSDYVVPSTNNEAEPGNSIPEADRGSSYTSEISHVLSPIKDATFETLNRGRKSGKLVRAKTNEVSHANLHKRNKTRLSMQIKSNVTTKRKVRFSLQNSMESFDPKASIQSKVTMDDVSDSFDIFEPDRRSTASSFKRKSILRQSTPNENHTHCPLVASNVSLSETRNQQTTTNKNNRLHQKKVFFRIDPDNLRNSSSSSFLLESKKQIKALNTFSQELTPQPNNSLDDFKPIRTHVGIHNSIEIKKPFVVLNDILKSGQSFTIHTSEAENNKSFCKSDQTLPIRSPLKENKDEELNKLINAAAAFEKTNVTELDAENMNISVTVCGEKTKEPRSRRSTIISYKEPSLNQKMRR